MAWAPPHAMHQTYASDLLGLMETVRQLTDRVFGSGFHFLGA